MFLLGARVGVAGEDVSWGWVRELCKEGGTPGDRVMRTPTCWGGRENCRGQQSASNLALCSQPLCLALRVTCEYFKSKPPTTSCAVSPTGSA